MNERRNENGMMTLWGSSCDTEKMAKAIRESDENSFEVRNTHETIYGWDFMGSLERALENEGVQYSAEVTRHDYFEGFPRTISITKISE